MDQTKDVTVNIADISSNPNDITGDEILDDVLDRLSFNPENLRYEDKLIDKYYEIDSISVITRTDDLFKYLSYYEKYLLYLHDYVEMSKKDIALLLKFDTIDEIEERFEDIIYKLELIEKDW